MNRRLLIVVGGILGALTFGGLLVGARGAGAVFVGIAVLALGLVLVVGLLTSGRRPASETWSTASAPAARTTTGPDARARARTPLALARVEARELVSSPWFAVGIGFCVLMFLLFFVVYGDDNGSEWADIAELAPWLAHPMVGMTVVAAHRNVTRSKRDRAEELFASCPASASARGLGHLGSAMVPAIGLAVFVVVCGVTAVFHTYDLHAAPTWDHLAIVLAAPVLGVGGAVLGIALGQNLRFGLVPIAAVIAVGMVSLKLATTGDPGWNPLAQLSTFPPLSGASSVFDNAPAWWHLAWIVGLTGLVAAATLLRSERRRQVAIAVGAFAVVVAVSGIGATRPMAPGAAALIADRVARPAAHQDCFASSPRVRVCAYSQYGELGERLAKEVAPVAAALPQTVHEVTLRQTYEDDIKELPPEVRRLLSAAPPGLAPGEAPAGYSNDAAARQGARIIVALAALRMPVELPDDNVPLVVAGEARGAVALWLAARGLDVNGQMRFATPQIGGSADPFDRGNPWPIECESAPVVWSAQDLEAVRRMMAAPEADVAAVVTDRLDHWADPATGTDELLAALHLSTGRPLRQLRESTRRMPALTAPLVALLAPTVRTARCGAVAVTVLLGGLPAVLSRNPAFAVLAALGAGAAVGWTTEDPARELLGSLPISSPARAAIRTLLVALVITNCLVLVSATVELRHRVSAGVVDRSAELTIAAAVALAVGFIATRRGERAGGSVAVALGILLPAVVAALAVRWPRLLPSFVSSPTHTRWWLLAAVAAVVALYQAREPSSRGLKLWSAQKWPHGGHFRAIRR